MILEDYTICYHGTIRRDSEYIKEKGIDLEKSRFATDFGKGFYLTNNLKQAETWAKIKHLDFAEALSKEDTTPVVIYFLLDAKKIKKLSGIHFLNPDQQWGQFVLDCRVTGMKKKVFHEYDYVKGPLADGKVMPLLRRFINGTIDKTSFIKGIMPKSEIHQQMSLHTQDAINCLRMMEVKEIEL